MKFHYQEKNDWRTDFYYTKSIRLFVSMLLTKSIKNWFITLIALLFISCGTKQVTPPLNEPLRCEHREDTIHVVNL